MFKRVEKRKAKRKEVEELGLEEGMEEIMGMQDTDSEESESDSDPESEGEGSGQEFIDDVHNLDEDEEDESEDEDPGLTVAAAVAEPVYIVSIDPDIKACIVCPGKLLKGSDMVQAHRASKAHERRLKQFKLIAKGADSDESAWSILKRNAKEQRKLSSGPLDPASGTSKRAEKKKKYLERQKAKREKVKKALAKKAERKVAKPAEPKSKENQEVNEPPDSPPKKKRKVIEPPGSPHKLVPQVQITKEGPSHNSDETTQKPTSNQSKKSVKEIVRSTANRALTARSKAGSKEPRKKVLKLP